VSRALDLCTYVVADVATILSRAGRDLAAVADVVRRAVDGGATIVQVRGKELGGAELLDVVERSAEAVAGRAALVVDDRVDVVLAARAAGARVDGVHVGQSDLPVDRVRALLGEGAIVGLSASRPHELAALRALPAGTADYLGVGAIRATPTKPDHPEPLGWRGFAEFAALAGLPCVAIGGVGHGDAAEARRAGAAGLAVVRAVCAAEDPAHAARSLRNEWAEVA
jgi:thiamine-phosphate diphosphorylase